MSQHGWWRSTAALAAGTLAPICVTNMKKGRMYLWHDLYPFVNRNMMLAWHVVRFFDHVGREKYTFHRIMWWRMPTAQRKPPEVRIWRFRNQSCVVTRPPS